MSYDPVAYTFIGCKIDPEKLYKKYKDRGCSCDIDIKKMKAEEAKFCPKCGKEIWVEKKSPIDGYDEAEQELNHMEILFDYMGEEAWVAMRVISTNQRKQAALFKKANDIENIKKIMKPILERYGMWDEDNFGLWNLLE